MSAAFCSGSAQRWKRLLTSQACLHGDVRQPWPGVVSAEEEEDDEDSCSLLYLCVNKVFVFVWSSSITWTDVHSCCSCVRLFGAQTNIFQGGGVEDRRLDDPVKLDLLTRFISLN